MAEHAPEHKLCTPGQGVWGRIRARASENTPGNVARSRPDVDVISSRAAASWPTTDASRGEPNPERLGAQPHSSHTIRRQSCDGSTDASPGWISLRTGNSSASPPAPQPFPLPLNTHPAVVATATPAPGLLTGENARVATQTYALTAASGAILAKWNDLRPRGLNLGSADQRRGGRRLRRSDQLLPGRRH